ncbi:MAG: DNA polymerase III subunit delta, partial [Pirellulaceae bacterium]|nr:DNA polymerase III subunit delta [Pirellulaceae bacterium]
LPIECRAPTAGGKRVDQRRVNKWLIARTKHHHLANLDSAAATLLVELQGLEFGLLDQELAKLALFAGQGGKIDVEMVRDVVGGWKGKTIWELVDSALDGDAADALKQLDRLLQSGEHPYALFGQLAWALRRFAAAAHCFEAAERSGKRPNLQDALLQAGFQNWNVGPAERQIKRLGRRRARKIYRWLLELDLSLKGTHSADDRARFALESLFLQLQSLPA